MDTGCGITSLGLHLFITKWLGHMAIQLSSSSKILRKMPDILILFENSLVGWMMKCKSIELLGHIQTIELKGFGCYIPLHFPKDIGILKLNMQPRDAQWGKSYWAWCCGLYELCWEMCIMKKLGYHNYPQLGNYFGFVHYSPKNKQTNNSNKKHQTPKKQLLKYSFYSWSTMEFKT